MTATHKFPMPTVSFGLTTSGAVILQAGFLGRLLPSLFGLLFQPTFAGRDMSRNPGCTKPLRSSGTDRYDVR